MSQLPTRSEMERIVDAIEAARGKGLNRAVSAHGITATTFYRWKTELAKPLPGGVSQRSQTSATSQSSAPMPAGGVEVIVEDLILQQIVSGDRGALIERIDSELARLRAEIEQKQEAVKRIEAFRRMLVPQNAGTAEKGASG